jgi:hypothetical protein
VRLRQIYEMLGKPDEIKVRNWEIKGEINKFRQDLVVGDGEKFSKFMFKRKAEQIQSPLKMKDRRRR